MSAYPSGALGYGNVSAFLSAVDVIRDELITEISAYGMWDGYDKDACRVSEIPSHIIDSVYYTVTFDAQGGECATSSKRVKDGDAVGTLPDATLDQHVHLGWFTAGGTQINSGTVINSDVTVYAKYMKSVMTLKKVGDVQVDDSMMASGFSSTSYLTSIAGDCLNFTDGLELVFRAKTEDSQPNQEIFGMTDAEAFEFGANGGQFMWEIATGGTSGSGTACQNGKWYYWKVVKAVGQYQYQCCYADGETVTESPSY